MLLNVLVTPSHNKWYQIGTLAKGNEKNTGLTQKKSHAEKGQHYHCLLNLTKHFISVTEQFPSLHKITSK